VVKSHSFERIEMADAASRIEPVTSFREPEGGTGSGRTKEKARARPKPAVVGAGQEHLVESIEPDESEKHDLDTLA
jgi:hypothetical protein